MFEVVNGTATKYVVLYGYDLLDITMYIAITLGDCDKKVIVCDVTDEKIVYSCVKSSEGEMKPVTIGKVKYCAGYTDECADIKIVCVGFSGKRSLAWSKLVICCMGRSEWCLSGNRSNFYTS